MEEGERITLLSPDDGLGGHHEQSDSQEGGKESEQIPEVIPEPLPTDEGTNTNTGIVSDDAGSKVPGSGEDVAVPETGPESDTEETKIVDTAAGGDDSGNKGAETVHTEGGGTDFAQFTAGEQPAEPESHDLLPEEPGHAPTPNTTPQHPEIDDKHPAEPEPGNIPDELPREPYSQGDPVHDVRPDPTTTEQGHIIASGMDQGKQQFIINAAQKAIER